jgi:addiction module HigA family antidote
MRQAMSMTKRKPATPGEILVEEWMQPIGLTQGALAKAMEVQRNHVNELCNDRRKVTAPTALILARMFGNSLAQCAAAKRSLEYHAFAARAQTIERAKLLTPAA